MPVRLPEENNVYHLFPVMCERRDEVQQYLAEHGVQTLIHYPIPSHMQECYAGMWTDLHLPITERLAMQELSLPISQVLPMCDVKTVVDLINAFK